MSATTLVGQAQPNPSHLLVLAVLAVLGAAVWLSVVAVRRRDRRRGDPDARPADRGRRSDR